MQNLWHMDADTYGHPNYGMGQTQEGQFFKGTGNRGPGEYKSLNPRGAIPVTLKWHMDGETYDRFIQAWNATGELRWGSNWFSLDLPLAVSDRLASNMPYDLQVRKRFNLSVENRDNIYGFSVAQNMGDVIPKFLFQQTISKLKLREDLLTVKTHQKVPLPDVNAAGLDVDFLLEGSDPVFLNWNGALDRYSNTVTDQAIIDHLANSVGTDIALDLIVIVQRFQRYNCHFRTAYTANMVGHNLWRVEADVVADVTEAFKIA